MYIFLSDAFDFTTVSEIPDEEELANTYYSQGDEFEDESCSSESDDEYDALMEHMNNALDLTGTYDSMALESIGSTGSSTSTTIRNKKIETLRG